MYFPGLTTEVYGQKHRKRLYQRAHTSVESYDRRLREARRDGTGPGKGKFMDVKQDGTKFKGVATEPDGRRTKR